jgi:holo-[acyl-carrier protein] synthase
VVVAHGVDIVDIHDFAFTADSSKQILSRIFTDLELEDAGSGATRLERLAGRFAAKEAILKALGRGGGSGIALTDVEIRTNRFGAPIAILRGPALELAHSLGITEWLVTTSHSGNVAVASVLAIAAEIG